MEQKVLLCILMFLTACEYDDLGIGTQPIDSKIIIETREVLGAESRLLTFQCKTEKSYECFNYPIATEKVENEHSVKITFTGIGEMPLCLTALGPARAVVDLKGQKNGAYQIELNNGDLKNEGWLRISDSEIELIILQQSGIEILRPVTKRVPPNTYWGTIKYLTPETTDKVNGFLQQLRDSGADFSKQEPGHYFYYEIDENGDIISDAQGHGSRFVQAFVFQHYGDEEEFREEFRALALPYHRDMSIYMETYRGKTVNNWTRE